MRLTVCGGCNAKVSAGSLKELLSRLPVVKRQDVIRGFEGNEDAAVIKITDEVAMVFTVDFFPAMVTDPYLFGQIAAANAMSDCYAMGAEVVSALNMVCFPEKADPQILAEILRGGAEKLVEAGATLSGGHSIHDEKIKYGLSVVGKVNSQRMWTNTGCQAGDYLILTKPLGVSLLVSAYLAEEANLKDYQAAVASMTQLNRVACQILSRYPITTVTDVTGFGLLGHLYEVLADEPDLKAEIKSADLPILEGAYQAARDFLFTQGGQKNRNYLEDKVEFKIDDYAMEEVLFDPQTSGGLLACVKPAIINQVVEDLRKEGLQATVIGRISHRSREREKTIIVD